MAELNDKLITYGNLSTFYNKLQEQGLGGNAIEDASVLPDASENKNKLIRLESDKSVYVGKYGEIEVPITPTNMLPEEEQIDKGGIWDDETKYVYKGLYSCDFSGETKDIYLYVPYYDASYHCTTVPITKLTSNDYVYDMDDSRITIDDLNKTITYNGAFNELRKMAAVDVDTQFYIIPATYNAPEANQIGKAYLERKNYADNGSVYIYTGVETTLQISGNNTTVYEWVNDRYPNNPIYSIKRASEIYFKPIWYPIGYGDGTTNYTSFNGYTITIFYDSNGNELMERTPFRFAYFPQINAVDSEQINKANIVTPDYYFIYNGVETTIQIDGNVTTVYTWETEDDVNVLLYSTKPASEINVGRQSSSDSSTRFFQNDNGTIIELGYGNFDDGILRVPYKRSTEQGFSYQWKPVVTEDEIEDLLPLTDNATNDDIDLMFVNEIKLIRAQEDDENYIDWLVNTSGETMEFNGQTYYKWVVWGNDFNDGLGPAVEYTNIVVLTNTLNVQLPFNSDSPEFEYMINVDSEEMFSIGYIHGDYTQKTVQ